MNVLRKTYCRIFQLIFRLALPILPYRAPKQLDSIGKIPELLKERSLNTVLLVTDSGLRNVGVTWGLEELLAKNNIKCIVYDKTCPNPTINNVEEARALYLDNKCKGIIAFGGGSPIDCAKVVGARIVYPKKSIGKMKGLLKVRRRLPPLIAIPTTAGTGSEVTLAAVVTNSETKHKYPINSFALIPHYTVLDPEVTYSLPPHLTATTGMDALTHATEAYIGKSTSRETRRCALKATKLIFENIELAYKNGKSYRARKNMLDASYMAGIAFSKSYVGYVHAVAHSLGGQYNIPHGLANSVLMPIVLESYGKAAYKKLHRLGIAAGVSQKEDSHEEGAKKFINAIKVLNSAMNIPEKLTGIKREDIPLMAEHADKEANPLYPVPRLMDARELSEFYYKVANWS